MPNLKVYPRTLLYHHFQVNGFSALERIKGKVGLQSGTRVQMGETLKKDLFPQGTDRLIQIIVHQFKKRTSTQEDIDDLTQIATIGLWRAQKRFDPSKSAWKTFATQIAQWALWDHIREVDWLSRLDRRRATENRTAVPKFGPLPVPTTRGSRMGGQFLPDRDIAGDDIPDPGDRSQLREECDRLLTGLKRRERAIVHLYAFEGLTMGEVGQAVGLSESRVSQIISRLRPELERRLARPASQVRTEKRSNANV